MNQIAISEIVEKAVSLSINEASGVNNELLAVSEIITQHIIDNHAFDLYTEITIDYDEDDEPDIDVDDYVDCNGEVYHYNLFYDDRPNHANGNNLGSNYIEINYYPIKRILDRIYTNLEKAPATIDRTSYITAELKEFLKPLIMHELTHSLDKSEPSTDHIWLKRTPPYHVSTEDIRMILYLFSDKELNARVGSAGAFMENIINDFFVFDGKIDTETINNLLQSGQQFKDFIDNYVIDYNRANNELRIDEMKTYLSLISRYNGFANKIDPAYLKNSGGKPSSIAYYLFVNDPRLCNNRNIKQLFNTNFNAGEKAVYNFYKGLYDNYLRKIYRACYAVLQNNSEKIVK